MKLFFSELSVIYVDSKNILEGKKCEQSSLRLINWLSA